MSIVISGDTGITQSALFNSSNTFGFKNRIINGGMVIDQRNAGASVTTASGSSVYTVDRWLAAYSQTSKFTVQQNAGSVTLPAGFINYLGTTSSSAYAVLTGDYFNIQQYIEGLNIADLAWGTANAKTVTLSFYVYSSLTGTFGGSLRNDAGNRSYPFSYTISSANTWTAISITIPGDTTGTWLTTTGKGINLSLGLGVGSTYSGAAGAWAAANYISSTGATSVVGTNGATFYITGVQLETGSVATTFDYRPYGTELQLCQRYYYKLKASVVSDSFGIGTNISATDCYATTFFPVPMRIAPTAVEQTGTAGDYNIRTGASTNCSGVPLFNNASVYTAVTDFVASGLTTGQAGWCRTTTTSAYLAWSAEL